MDSLVPIIGHEAFTKNTAFVARLKYIIEEEFGHELRFLDGGRILELLKADSLKTTVPFAIAMSGVSPALKADLLDALHQVFPSSFLVTGTPESLPRSLK